MMSSEKFSEYKVLRRYTQQTKANEHRETGLHTMILGCIW